MKPDEIESALKEAIHIPFEIERASIDRGHFPGQREADLEFNRIIAEVRQHHEAFEELTDDTTFEDLESGLDLLGQLMSESEILRENHIRHLQNPIRVCLDGLQRCGAVLFDCSRFASECGENSPISELPVGEIFTRQLTSDQLSPFNERINQLRHAVLHLSVPTESKSVNHAQIRASTIFPLYMHLMFNLDEILLDREFREGTPSPV
jgi:hypothetical protein